MKTNKLLMLCIVFLAGLSSFAYANTAGTNVVISEVLYDAVGPDGGYEFVELHNPTNAIINISGWKIQKGGTAWQTTATLPANQSIRPYGYYLIGENETLVGVSLDYKSALDFENGGTVTDGVKLLNSLNSVIDTLLYDTPNLNNLLPEEGTPALDVQSGNSLERKPGYATPNCGNWQDTDDNSADFLDNPNPEPQNSGANETPCGNDTTPPASVSNLQFVNRTHDNITWSWTNPSEPDFDEAILYLNGINYANTTSSSALFYELEANTSYTITIHTKDYSGNVNNTDVNDTRTTLASPSQNDTTPPTATVNNVGGDTTQPYNSTNNQTTIVADLNEQGDCRMSDSDESYDNMSDNFDCAGDGTTQASCQHSQQADGSYTAYIACKDLNNNKNSATDNLKVDYIVDTLDITSQCQDSIDNDGDGLTDLADPGCSSPSDNDESDATSQCQDTIDNDGDGAIDFPNDFSCSSSTDNDETNPKAQCQDSIDNDGDSLTDLADPGCANAQDNNESDGTSQCQDTIDNDADGATDFPADFSCSSPIDDNETYPKAQCQDGINNDGDSYIDYPADPGCTSQQDNNEGDTIAPAISNLNATNITNTSANIYWETNELANSTVYYGKISLTNIAYSSQSTLAHNIPLSGLEVYTTYYYLARSCDSDGNCNDSTIKNFRTSQNPPPADTTPPTATVNNVGGDTTAPYNSTNNQTTIVADLNEQGDCRMSDSDESYDNMSDNFDCAGDGTAQASCQHPEQADGSYTAYIACKDLNNNKNSATDNLKVDYIVDTPGIAEIPLPESTDDLQINYLRGRIIIDGITAPSGTSYKVELLSGDNNGMSYEGTVDDETIPSFLNSNGFFDTQDQLIFTTDSLFRITSENCSGSYEGQFASGGNGNFLDENTLINFSCAVLPVIEDVYHSPGQPDETEEIFIFANVTDNLGVGKVVVNYTVNQTNVNSKEMSLNGANRYSTSLGIFDAASIIDYFITARDINGNYAVSASYTITISNVDSDEDGIIDMEDNCPFDPNADQLDTDSDAQGNACDDDDDNDGLNDTIELDASDGATTNPLVNDSDGDGLSDGDEDANKNGQVDSGETDPNEYDTDGDGYNDSEDAFPTDPDRWLLLVGDVNKDNAVNILDLIVTRNAMGSKSGDSNWNEDADVNGEGNINILDLIIIRNNFG